MNSQRASASASIKKEFNCRSFLMFSNTIISDFPTHRTTMCDRWGRRQLAEKSQASVLCVVGAVFCEDRSVWDVHEHDAQYVVAWHMAEHDQQERNFPIFLLAAADSRWDHIASLHRWAERTMWNCEEKWKFTSNLAIFGEFIGRCYEQVRVINLQPAAAKKYCLKIVMRLLFNNDQPARTFTRFVYSRTDEED